MKRRAIALAVVMCTMMVVPTFAQSHSTAESVRGHFKYINKKLLEMAKDFPEDKYDYKMKPEMRSFRELLIHIAGGNIYVAKAGKGEKVEWNDLDPKNYPTKADVIAMFEKTVADANATLDAVSDEELTKTADPWIDVIEHSAEHYGLLVAYYRQNGIVPPSSRKK